MYNQEPGVNLSHCKIYFFCKAIALTYLHFFAQINFKNTN